MHRMARAGDVWALCLRGANQLKDLAASALTNEFVTLICCGLCGFERRKPQPPIGVADSWDKVVTSF